MVLFLLWFAASIVRSSNRVLASQVSRARAAATQYFRRVQRPRINLVCARLIRQTIRQRGVVRTGRMMRGVRVYSSLRRGSMYVRLRLPKKRGVQYGYIVNARGRHRGWMAHSRRQIERSSTFRFLIQGGEGYRQYINNALRR